VIAAGMRIYRQVTLPLHLRWELYPVKHEVGKKAEYGGSYMEEPNWWEKERKRSLINELKYMVPEILLLRGLREENPQLWKVSFPFHFGLYLLLGTFLLLFIGALAMVGRIPIAPGKGSIPAFLHYLTILVGTVGLIAGTIGSFGLLFRRLADAELKNYSTLADYLNLFFFLLFFGISFLTWLFHDLSFQGARFYVYSLLTFGGRPEGMATDRSFLGNLTVVIASFLVAYIPLTHMSHVFMKFFMYHFVRWDDEPNLKGSKIELAILKNLGFKPTWAAPHISSYGKKSWAEISVPGPKK